MYDVWQQALSEATFIFYKQYGFFHTLKKLSHPYSGVASLSLFQAKGDNSDTNISFFLDESKFSRDFLKELWEKVENSLENFNLWLIV